MKNKSPWSLGLALLGLLIMAWGIRGIYVRYSLPSGGVAERLGFEKKMREQHWQVVQTADPESPDFKEALYSLMGYQRTQSVDDERFISLSDRLFQSADEPQQDLALQILGVLHGEIPLTEKCANLLFDAKVSKNLIKSCLRALAKRPSVERQELIRRWIKIQAGRGAGELLWFAKDLLLGLSGNEGEKQALTNEFVRHIREGRYSQEVRPIFLALVRHQSQEPLVSQVALEILKSQQGEALVDEALAFLVELKNGEISSLWAENLLRPRPQSIRAYLRATDLICHPQRLILLKDFLSQKSNTKYLVESLSAFTRLKEAGGALLLETLSRANSWNQLEEEQINQTIEEIKKEASPNSAPCP